ncbi:response regulator [Candidatus Dependentiae bacterium]|nr:response regulator [Candidatus Dependentiae bacterium]
MKKQIKILLVDDNDNQRLLYTQELEEEGYNIVTASNGKEAVDKVLSEKPDLVILDIQMPGINGIETLDEILTYNKQLPIILHSAYSNYKENFMSWAADAYIVKSSNLDELKKNIDKILKNRGIV